MSSRRGRWSAWGGVVGPVGFVGAWAVGGALAGPGYSPVDDPISRLAAVGAATRPLMTAGFVTFGLALPVYSSALRRHVDGAAWFAAATTGLATLAVAAAPLDRSEAVDAWHGIAAGVGYVSLALVPLLAARPLRRRGATRLAAAGMAAGAVSVVALALTATSLPTGLFQRIGLTATDLWLVASALVLWRGELRSS